MITHNHLSSTFFPTFFMTGFLTFVSIFSFWSQSEHGTGVTYDHISSCIELDFIWAQNVFGSSGRRLRRP